MPPQWGRTRNRHGVEPFEDATLHIHKQTVRRIGDATCNRNQQDARQQIIYIVIRAGLNCAAEHIDKQQHKRNRHDSDRDDGVHAAKNMAHGASKHNAHIAEKVFLDRFHYFFSFLPMIARNISSKLGCFSIYSTFAGGNSFFRSASVPFAIILPSCRMAILSASCSASSKYCVVRSTVVPLLASSLTVFQTSMRASGPSPLVGSSRKMSCGFPTRLMAMSSLRRIPPNRWKLW